MPSYSNPAARTASGSRKFRPSTISGVRIESRTSVESELLELGPFGDDHRRIGIPDRVEQ